MRYRVFCRCENLPRAESSTNQLLTHLQDTTVTSKSRELSAIAGAGTSIVGASARNTAICSRAWLMLLAKCPLLPVMRLAAMEVIRHNINRLERRLFAECTSWERIVPRFSGRKESLERVSCFGQDTDSLIGWS